MWRSANIRRSTVLCSRLFAGRLCWSVIYEQHPLQEKSVKQRHVELLQMQFACMITLQCLNNARNAVRFASLIGDACFWGVCILEIWHYILCALLLGLIAH